jgi:hypothetical protein
MEKPMGRPPIGKVAMTASERVRRFASKQYAAEVERLQSRIRELEAGSPRERQQNRIAEFEARIRDLEAELARERAKKAPPRMPRTVVFAPEPAANTSLPRGEPEQQTSSEEDKRWRDYLSPEQVEIRGLKAALGRERTRSAQLEAQLETVPAAERDHELSRLKNANRELRIKVKYLREYFDAQLKVAQMQMPAAVKRALQKCLTADAPTKAAKVEALTGLMDWVNRKASAERKKPRQNR